MAYERLKGIVIKETVTEEADKILTLLTDKKGKISVYAKGAKKTRSGIALSTQFLCYSDFVLFKGKDLYSLNSAEVIEPFYEIREDIEKVVYCSHVMEIINDGVSENQPEVRVMKLLLNTLFMIMKPNGRNIDLIVKIFELKFLCYIGFYLELKGCKNCGDIKEEDRYNCNINGSICDICCKRNGIALKMMTGTKNALTYIAESEIKNLFNFNVSDLVLKELKIIIESYLECIMEKKYVKLKFLNDVKFL